MRQGIVIDTNILVNALRRGSDNRAKSRKLLKDVYMGRYCVYVSSEIEDEYVDVLSRPQLKVSRFKKAIWFAWMRTNAIYIEPRPSTQQQVQMKDEDDRIFFDVAKCVNAKLITRNVKDYPIHELITSISELY
jgi:predicted nucleic acid-binding protein